MEREQTFFTPEADLFNLMRNYEMHLTEITHQISEDELRLTFGKFYPNGPAFGVHPYSQQWFNIQNLHQSLKVPEPDYFRLIQTITRPNNRSLINKEHYHLIGQGLQIAGDLMLARSEYSHLQAKERSQDIEQQNTTWYHDASLRFLGQIESEQLLDTNIGQTLVYNATFGRIVPPLPWPSENFSVLTLFNTHSDVLPESDLLKYLQDNPLYQRTPEQRLRDMLYLGLFDIDNESRVGEFQLRLHSLSELVDLTNISALVGGEMHESEARKDKSLLHLHTSGRFPKKVETAKNLLAMPGGGDYIQETERNFGEGKLRALARSIDRFEYARNFPIESSRAL